MNSYCQNVTISEAKMTRTFSFWVGLGFDGK